MGAKKKTVVFATVINDDRSSISVLLNDTPIATYDKDVSKWANSHTARFLEWSKYDFSEVINSLYDFFDGNPPVAEFLSADDLKAAADDIFTLALFTYPTLAYLETVDAEERTEYSSMGRAQYQKMVMLNASRIDSVNRNKKLPQWLKPLFRMMEGRTDVARVAQEWRGDAYEEEMVSKKIFWFTKPLLEISSAYSTWQGIPWGKLIANINFFAPLAELVKDSPHKVILAEAFLEQQEKELDDFFFSEDSALFNPERGFSVEANNLILDKVAVTVELTSLKRVKNLPNQTLRYQMSPTLWYSAAVSDFRNGMGVSSQDGLGILVLAASLYGTEVIDLSQVSSQRFRITQQSGNKGSDIAFCRLMGLWSALDEGVFQSAFWEDAKSAGFFETVEFDRLFESMSTNFDLFRMAGVQLILSDEMYLSAEDFKRLLVLYRQEADRYASSLGVTLTNDVAGRMLTLNVLPGVKYQEAFAVAYNVDSVKTGSLLLGQPWFDVSQVGAYVDMPEAWLLELCG